MSNFKIAICLIFEAHFIIPQVARSYFKGPNTVNSWVDGEAYCQSQGTTLASIPTYDDIVAAGSTCASTCWIGLKDENEEGVWEWTDGTEIASSYGFDSNGTATSGQAPWNGNGNPDNWQGIEDCVEFHGSGWYNDITCSGIGLYPLCNEQSTTSNPTTSTPASVPRSYFKGPNTVNSWADGESYCQSQGTTLASIPTYNDWVAAYSACAYSYCWIGLNDEYEEGVWEWTDGTDTASSYGFNADGTPTAGIAPWNWDGWHAGEPNGLSDSNCIEMLPTNGLYNDLQCTGTGHYPLCNEATTTSNPTTSHPTTTTPTTRYPTNDPTSMPSESPTYLNCEEAGDIKHIDWEKMIEDGGNQIPDIDYDISISSIKMTLTINIILDYLGYSFINNNYGFGTRYHLGFYSFQSDSIVSNCDNRLASSFLNKTWTQQWEYSEYPYLNNSIGSDNYLAYPPPSKYWTLSMDQNNSCSKIKYTAIFTWQDLRECTSDDGTSSAVVVDIDDNYINMSGTFFVDIVSPISMNADLVYRSYELLSYPFTISIKKPTYIIADIHIFGFTILILDVGKDNEDQNILNIKILTESTDYVLLTNPIILASPDYDNSRFKIINNESECLYVTPNLCGQVWEIEINVECPFIFDGEFAFQFDANCNGNDNSEACMDYIITYGPHISLSSGLTFEDQICKNELWSIEYNANMIFYTNETYTTSVPNVVISGDRVFVEIVVDDFDVDNNGYAVLDLQLLNVWLCTSQYELSIDLNNLTNSGCFSSFIDSGGPYHIIINHDEFIANGTKYEPEESNNMVRFSFIIPSTIIRNTIFIQTQIKLTFTENETNRRLLLQTTQKSTTQMMYESGSISFSNADSDVDVDSNATENNVDNKTTEIYIGIISALSCILLLSICICFVIICKRNNSQKFKHNYGNVVSEQVVVDEIQNNDTSKQSIIKQEEDV